VPCVDADIVDRVYEVLQCRVDNLSIMLVENVSFHRQTYMILSIVIVYIIRIVQAVDLDDSLIGKNLLWACSDGLAMTVRSDINKTDKDELLNTANCS